MARILSAFFTEFFADRALLDERAYNSHVGMLLTLKGGAQLAVATGEFTLTSVSSRGASIPVSPPVFFEEKLLSAPEIQFSQTSSADGSTGATVGNLDYLLSGLMVEETRILDGAKVTVYICLEKPDGSYEGMVYGVGNVRASDADEETARLNYVSDLSDRNSIVGGRELTQKCLNELGVVAGKSFCPAPNAIGGFCSKIFDDSEAGCDFWQQQAFFNGVPFYNPNSPTAAVTNGGGGIGGIGGDGSGWAEPTVVGWGCPDVNSFLKTPTGWQRGRELKAGDKLIDHLDRIVLIEKIEVIRSAYRYLIESSSGARGIFSANHPVLTDFDDATGTALYALTENAPDNEATALERIVNRQSEAGIIPPRRKKDGAAIVEFSAGAARLSQVKFSVTSAGDVLKISIGAPNIYIAGLTKGAGFAGHNVKPIYNDLQGWATQAY